MLRLLGSSHIPISDFKFHGGSENLYEIAFEFVVLHRVSSQTRLEGFWGPVLLESDRKLAKTQILILVSYYDRY